MKFNNMYGFLSNSTDSHISIGLDGIEYNFKNVESAFQSFKDPSKMYEFTKLDSKEARELGKKVNLREDWEDIKDDVMDFLIKIKFEDNKTWQTRLLKITEPIINESSNTYWGIDSEGNGQNKLGEMITKVRDDIKENPNIHYNHNANHLCKEFVKEREDFRNSISKSANVEIRELGNNKVNHCKNVAKYMMEHSGEFNLNPQISYVVGLLHDIGYIEGRKNHEQNGAELLEIMGVEERYLNAIKYHGKDPYTLNKDDISPMLVLLQEADMSVDKDGHEVGFKGRLADIEKRYGKDHNAYKTAVNEIKFSKEYRENFLAKTEMSNEYSDTLESIDISDKIINSNKHNIIEK